MEKGTANTRLYPFNSPPHCIGLNSYAVTDMLGGCYQTIHNSASVHQKIHKMLFGKIWVQNRVNTGRLVIMLFFLFCYNNGLNSTSNSGCNMKYEMKTMAYFSVFLNLWKSLKGGHTTKTKQHQGVITRTCF